jgi:hypothetical protein
LLFQLAKLVADEFFDQGDMEKLQLNITPIVSIAEPYHIHAAPGKKSNPTQPGSTYTNTF